jgi:hypothetical protein
VLIAFFCVLAVAVVGGLLLCVFITIDNIGH